MLVPAHAQGVHAVVALHASRDHAFTFEFALAAVDVDLVVNEQATPVGMCAANVAVAPQARIRTLSRRLIIGQVRGCSSSGVGCAYRMRFRTIMVARHPLFTACLSSRERPHHLFNRRPRSAAAGAHMVSTESWLTPNADAQLTRQCEQSARQSSRIRAVGQVTRGSAPSRESAACEGLRRGCGVATCPWAAQRPRGRPGHTCPP